MFTTANDEFGPYFLFAPEELFIRNATNAKHYGVASFLHNHMIVPSPYAAPIFHLSLPSPWQQLLIAILVLVMLLLLDALLQAGLLLPPPSPSRLSFLRLLLHSRSFHSIPSSSLLRVLPSLVLLLLAHFLIILLSQPFPQSTSNAQRAFTLIQPLSPDWTLIHPAASSQVNVPCLSPQLTEITTSQSSLVLCVTSSLPPTVFPPFNNPFDLTLILTTDLHLYGSEHTIRFIGQEQSFSARAFLTPFNSSLRVLKQRQRLNRQDEQVKLVHKQFMAYLFTQYNRQTNDSSLSLSDLQSLNFDYTPASTDNGRVIDIIQMNNGTAVFQTPTFRYESNITGKMPSGDAVFNFAQVFFKGIIGVEIGGGDQIDLFPNDGVQAREDVLWIRSLPYLNWFSLLLIIVPLFGVLIFLRSCFHPPHLYALPTDLLKRRTEHGIEVSARADDEGDEVEGKWWRWTRSDTTNRLGAGADRRLLTTQEYHAANGLDTKNNRAT